MSEYEIETISMQEAYNIGFDDGFKSGKFGVLCKHKPVERTCNVVRDMWFDGIGCDYYCSECDASFGESEDGSNATVTNYCPECGAKVIQEVDA